MPKFGNTSISRLRECHPLLQRLFLEVVREYDCSILVGHRAKREQDHAFESKMSRLKWPNSKHNKVPSLAIDVAPYPLNWQDQKRFYHFGGFVKGMALGLGIPLRWGGDWDGDEDLNDQTFMDLVHFELKI